MKYLFVLNLLFTSLLISAQQSIKFEEGSFKDILAKAKKDNKIIFMDAYASWCGPCKLMEKNVFTDAAVRDFYNGSFINSRFDMEKGEGRDIARKYQIGSYPTFLFLNGDGEELFRGMGYMAAGDFIEMGRQANNPFSKKGSLKSQFEKGESDPDFLKNAIKIYANSDPEFAKKASERYFKLKKDKAFTKEEISMLLYFLKSTEDPNYLVFKNSKTEIVKLLPENIYNQFEAQLRLPEISHRALDVDKKTVNDALFLSEASKLMGAEEAAKALTHLKLSFYLSVGNFKDYETTAVGYYKDGEGFAAQELAAVAAVFSNKVEDPTSLKKAVVWAEKAIMTNETAENAFVLGQLYQKTGNREGAKAFGEVALRLGKQNGADTTAVQNFLNAVK